jgi:hypothetical protein
MDPNPMIEMLGRRLRLAVVGGGSGPEVSLETLRVRCCCAGSDG